MMAILLEFVGLVLGIALGWCLCAKACAAAVVGAITRHHPEDVEDQAVEMGNAVFDAMAPGPMLGWMDRRVRAALEREGQEGDHAD